MTTNNLTNIEVDEISILSKDVRPAVRRARIAITKKETPMSFATLEEAVSHLQKLHGCPRSLAMSKAAHAHPDLVQKYNADGVEFAKAAADASKRQPVSKAALEFEDKVDEIAKARGLPRHQAMSKARQRYPAEFAAAYGRES